MTSSRGGIPCGKSVFRRVLRLIAAVGAWALEPRPPIERLGRRAVPAVFVAAARVLPRRLTGFDFARVVAPATPWAWRRWAPSAAARANVRPHSGHVNCSVFDPGVLTVFVLLAIELLLS